MGVSAERLSSSLSSVLEREAWGGSVGSGWSDDDEAEAEAGEDLSPSLDELSLDEDEETEGHSSRDLPGREPTAERGRRGRAGMELYAGIEG
jgi:hypothetical protein